MKALCLSFLTLLSVSICTRSVHAQNYSAVKKVYYTPIEEKIYFSLDLNPMITDSVGQVFIKTKKTDININDIPTYKKNEKYNPGDIVKVKIKQMSGDTYSYVKIIDMLDSKILESIDSSIKTKSANTFGGGKLEPWPENFIEEKPWGLVHDEKGISCDYYIISAISNFNPRFGKLVYGEENTSLSDGENLICFYVDKISNDEWGIKEIDDLTSDFYKIEIMEKQKEGKKGKKIGKSTTMNLTKEKKTVSNTYEMKLDGVSTIRDAWEKMNASIPDIITAKELLLRQNVLSGIKDAFADL